jgi:Flp pilus assembly protein TadG
MARLTKSSKRRGLAVVEMALLIPLLLIFVMGVLEYGWMFYRYQQITGAARHGARVWARADATVATATAAIDTLMSQANMGGSGYTSTFVYTGNQAQPAAPGSTLTVTVMVNYANVDLIGFSLIPVPSQMRGKSSFVKDGP